MLEMKGRIKQFSARSGFRSSATTKQKYTTKKPKSRLIKAKTRHSPQKNLTTYLGVRLNQVYTSLWFLIFGKLLCFP